MTDDSMPAEGSEFPADPAEVNWGILKQFAERSHPLVNNDWQAPDVEGATYLIEMFCEMRAVHHLLDLAGVPQGYGLDTRAIDARTLIAIMALGSLRERLARISAWHARETGPAGTVGDLCIECGHRWPCDSQRMADGTYTEEGGTDVQTD